MKIMTINIYLLIMRSLKHKPNPRMRPPRRLHHPKIKHGRRRLHPGVYLKRPGEERRRRRRRRRRYTNRNGPKRPVDLLLVVEIRVLQQIRSRRGSGRPEMGAAAAGHQLQLDPARSRPVVLGCSSSAAEAELQPVLLPLPLVLGARLASSAVVVS